jgi:hypothetical protein
MKKMRKVVAALMLMMAVVLAAGCKPENDSNNGGGDNEGNTYNGHEFVDLGLPSGTLWATCNVGAETPEAYGDNFAWGETTPKEIYDWDTYKYGSDFSWDPQVGDDVGTLTKYNTNPDWGQVDNLTTLQPKDDAATANWGDGWCMPTRSQWVELNENTTTTWAIQNGVAGRFFTATNGKSIFLPAGHELHKRTGGWYWASTLYFPRPQFAYILRFDTDGCYCSDDNGTIRCKGLSVRPVRSSAKN